MPDPAAGRRVLSPVEFDVVWRALGLGAPPVVLQLRSPGRTHTERRQVEAEAWSTLRGRGLAGLSGPEPGLDRLLRLLAAPTSRVELRAWGVHAVRAVVAAEDHDDGALVLRRDDVVALETCFSIPGTVVRLLGSGRPGPGRAAVVPGMELDQALRHPSGHGLRADLVARGVDRQEAGLMARMLHGIDRRAQVTAVAPDRWGTLRPGGLLEVLDAPRGRYLLTRARTDDGTPWACVAPADDRRLRQRLAGLLRPWADGAAQSRSPCLISCRPASVIEPDSEG